MNTHKHHTKRNRFVSHLIKESVYALFGLALIASAFFVVWIATIKLPDFSDFENRKIANSTKIYDRTGKVVLYNIHENIKRSVVQSDQISDNIKKAAVAIEDSHFYEHHGIRLQSIIRAVLANIASGEKSQGGSTITQQVIKNSLLTREKTIPRKIKEWILAIKLDAQLDKDTILTMYLNESPYGGSIYGVEEASQSYFGKSAKDVTLVEAAYLAAMPQAPSYYSPYGKHLDALEDRKNLVLSRMFELNMIDDTQYTEAKNTRIEFQPQENNNGKAFHFVFMVRDYLENKYGEDMVENGGLKIISTLDWNMQKNAEEIVKQGALDNEKKYKAENAALVAIDVKTGQILSLVGSRDYFDKGIDGQYNIATALRQPGSAFKPIVYLLAFMKGLTPDTVLFDLPTQFSTYCDAYGNPLSGTDKKKCYMPVNYDGQYRGPISLRSALQQSLNIPAVKTLYLVGVQNAINFAKSLGITTLGDSSRFGLSLVLGGGEVTLLELTNTYAVFANNGVYNPPAMILEVRDLSGNVLEKYTPQEKDIVPKEYTDILSDVLTDNNARIPAFGSNSALYFPDRPVAAKTGTTNDYKDVWVVGYTPDIAVGMWAGNNDNTPIDKKVAGMVVAPIWKKFMSVALNNTPISYFDKPAPTPADALPIIRGIWCGAGQPVHTILGDIGSNGGAQSYNDSQYNLWNTPIQEWALNKPCPFGGDTGVTDIGIEATGTTVGF